MDGRKPSIRSSVEDQGLTGLRRVLPTAELLKTAAIGSAGGYTRLTYQRNADRSNERCAAGHHAVSTVSQQTVGLPPLDEGTYGQSDTNDH